MHKAIGVLTLALAVTSFASVYDSNPSENISISSEANYIHNAFFFEFSAGPQYLHFLEDNTFQNTYYDYDYDLVLDTKERHKKFYEGYGPEFDFKIGGLFKSRLAVYAHFNYSNISDGKYRYSERRDGKYTEKIAFNADAHRFFVGGGTNFYFVRNPESIWYGLYLGGSMGFVIDYAGKSIVRNFDGHTEFDEQGIAWTLETGKLWRVWDLLHVGIYGRAAMDAPIRFTDDDSGDSDDEENISYYTLSFGVVFTRK